MTRQTLQSDRKIFQTIFYQQQIDFSSQEVGGFVQIIVCLLLVRLWGVRCEVDANVYDGREVWLTSIVIPVQTWTLCSVKHIIVHSFSHAINIFKRNTNITEIYLTVMYLTEMYRAVPHFCNCIIGFNGSRTSFTYFFNTTLENPL